MTREIFEPAIGQRVMTEEEARKWERAGLIVFCSDALETRRSVEETYRVTVDATLCARCLSPYFLDRWGSDRYCIDCEAQGLCDEAYARMLWVDYERLNGRETRH